MTPVIEKPTGKPRCPNCKRQKFYHVKHNDTFRCQACGHVWPANSEPSGG